MKRTSLPFSMILCALCVLWGASSSRAAAQTSTAKPYQYIRIGAKTGIHVHPRAGYALMGGGTDLDAAFRWLCDRADGGDFLVLRASGTGDYNPYIQPLCHLNSVATLIIPTRAAANDPFVAKTITKAAAIFISGGDQGKYIGNWAHSPVETALRAAVRRGVPIGGTSAGLAVLGQYIYSAQNDKPDDSDLASDKALANPFYRQVVIAPDLLGIPILRGVITDTHFDTRHREGRLLVFMARVLASGQAKTIRAIGVDERNAVLVDPDGHAQVVGKKDGEADLFEAIGKPQVCEPGQPLTFGPIHEQIAPTGTTIDLADWEASGKQAQLFVKEGKVFTQ
ncbi:MAG TPA: cyanophycinase [Acidobacteriaceae bacterium]|jgi:cyanophycinase|nr:cyanophycinase [Acidobacteriaceae bacterium]